MSQYKKNNDDKPVLMVTNYLDNVYTFSRKQPFFYDKTKIFWFWNKTKHKWEIVDEIDLMNSIEAELKLTGETVTTGIRGNYLESFKRIGRLNKPKDAPKTWIQFNDTIIDINTKERFEATPDYFMTNPIPWNISERTETPILDKLFTEWVGDAYKDTLYEILAYCTLADYPLHTIFCLIGSGRNGKSTYSNLLRKFIGDDNVTSAELDTLVSRPFEAAKLYKKLVCNMNETNFGTLRRTSLLKRITGQDLIGFEMKNKNPFDDINYAKILISSNSLPTSDDNSEGFYRRWLIIDFPNNFTEGHDVLTSIPDEEYEALAAKCVKILPELIKKGRFSNQGDIASREKSYLRSSNPISLFIQDFCKVESDKFCRYSELYNLYAAYLKQNKRRIISKIEFSKSLVSEGFEVRRTSKNLSGDGWERDNFVEGIEIDHEKASGGFIPNTIPNLLTFSYRNLSRKYIGKRDKDGTASVLDVPVEAEVMLLPCKKCGIAPTSATILNFEGTGTPLCTICYQNELEANEK